MTRGPGVATSAGLVLGTFGYMPPERAGTPFLLDTQNNVRVPSDASADGKQIAFYTSAIVRRISLSVTRRRHAARQRRRATRWGPMFTPDGRSLVFYSARDGN